MLKQLLVCVLLLIAIAPKAQMVNLVPNYSFEEYDTCPTADAQLSYVEFWLNPSQGSPDYFNSCSPLPWFSTPSNAFGFQGPKSGSAYVGFGTYNSAINNYREYISVKLDSDMTANKQYCISFYLSLSDSCNYKASPIGIYLSNTFNYYQTGYNLSLIPQIIVPNNICKDTWALLEGKYIAMGGERYITIGNFNNDVNSEVTYVGGSNFNTSYYFIDDVYVGPCEESLTIPNVFTPNNDGINDVFVVPQLIGENKLTVYNRWGNIVYQSTNYQNNWDGDNCTDGVYFYILELPFGTVKKGTVTILRE